MSQYFEQHYHISLPYAHYARLVIIALWEIEGGGEAIAGFQVMNEKFARQISFELLLW
jgi:hypothetical protein